MSDKTDKTELGDRMKAYEAVETDRVFEIGKPIYARMDGRGFSKFTSGMKKPYDEAMSQAMIETTKYLVEETHASIGYVQSDEISLVWKHTEQLQAFFGGRKDKMLSTLSALTTAKFLSIAMLEWPEKCAERLPVFDARVIQMPDKEEIANMILWRCIDARKNSISMAAHSHFGTKPIHKKSSSERLKMLKDDGIDWNEYPDFFKYGTFIQKAIFKQTLTTAERLSIPEKFRPAEDQVFERSRVTVIDVPYFNEVQNRSKVIFNGAKPLV